MDLIKKILTSKNLYFSLIAIIIVLIIYLILKRAINKVADKEKEKISKKRLTYLRLLKSILKYVSIAFLILTILQINGINVTSLIAGLGLVSVIGGLSLQDALKDIIMGFNLIVDDYFSVDDVITIDDVEGKVISLGLKNTKILELSTGCILVIANRNISKAKIAIDRQGITLPLPYELSSKDADKVIDLICQEINTLKNVKNAKCLGIDAFAPSAIEYKLVFDCKAEDKVTLKRQAQCIIKRILDENNIAIPYMQIDVHNK